MIRDTLKNIIRTKLQMEDNHYCFTSHWEKQVRLKQIPAY